MWVHVKLCKVCRSQNVENYNVLAVVLNKPDILATLTPHGAGATFTYAVAPKEPN
jgi:hypothetical protein